MLPYSSYAGELFSEPEASSDPRRIWIANLPAKITEFAIVKIVRQFGELDAFHFPVHKMGDLQGSSIGYCFITFKKQESATKALSKLNGFRLHGNILSVHPARPTKDQLQLAQSRLDESRRLEILQKTQEQEARLAEVLAKKVDTDPQALSTTNVRETSTPFSNVVRVSGGVMPVIPDLYGKLGRTNASQMIPPIPTAIGRVKSRSSAQVAINRIENALRRLRDESTRDGNGVQPAVVRTETVSRPHPAVAHLLATKEPKRLGGQHRSGQFVHRGRSDSFRNRRRGRF